MRSSNTLQDIRLSSLQLLDLAYIVVLLPIMLVLKVPMFMFVFMILGLLLFMKKPANQTLILFVFVMGILALFLSLYGVFSFRGLSRLKLFLELLISLLISSVDPSVPTSLSVLC